MSKRYEVDEIKGDCVGKIWNRNKYTPGRDHFENDYDTIYLLTAIGLSPAGSSTVHIYTQTIHRTIQNKQYIEQYNNLLFIIMNLKEKRGMNLFF